MKMKQRPTASAIIKLVITLLNLAARIIEIAAKKGDDADNMRLKDIPGWQRLKREVRHREAVDVFLRKYRERG